MGLPSNGTTSEPSQLPGHTWNPMGSLRDCGSVSRGVGGHQKKNPDFRFCMLIFTFQKSIPGKSFVSSPKSKVILCLFFGEK